MPWVNPGHEKLYLRVVDIQLKRGKAHVECKANNNILLFYPFVQDANNSFVSRFAFVLCIKMSAVPPYLEFHYVVLVLLLLKET